MFEKEREKAREFRETLTDPTKRSQIVALHQQDHPAVWEFAQLGLVAALLRSYDPARQTRILDAFMDYYLQLLASSYFWEVGNPHGDLRAFLLRQPHFALLGKRVKQLSRYAHAVKESSTVYDLLKKEQLPSLPRQTSRRKQLMQKHGISPVTLLEAQGKILEQRAKALRKILKKMPGFSRVPQKLVAQWSHLSSMKDIAVAAVAWKYKVHPSTVKRFSIAGLIAAHSAELDSIPRILRESLQERPMEQLFPDEKKLRRWLTTLRKHFLEAPR